MDREALLAMFDHDQRKTIVWDEMRREETPHLIRHINLSEPRSAIGWFDARGVADLDALIEQEKAYFGGIGHEFEWKVYSYDEPVDMTTRLAAHGFNIEEPDAIMVLEIESAPARLFEPIPAYVQRITDPARTVDVTRVLNAVWDDDEAWLEARLAKQLREKPDEMSLFIAYMDDQPVSCAWITYHPGAFAGLWGGSTLAAYRGRGIYTALLAARLQEAKARGVPCLTIDASAMSQPIVSKQGFVQIAQAWECTWSPE